MVVAVEWKSSSEWEGAQMIMMMETGAAEWHMQFYLWSEKRMGGFIFAQAEAGFVEAQKGPPTLRSTAQGRVHNLR